MINVALLIFVIGIAALSATLNNDPETLEALVNWKEGKEAREDKSSFLDNDPITIACIEGYNQCIGPLYRLGYRLNLPKEGLKKISMIMNLEPISNKIHFWWVTVRGKVDAHISELVSEDQEDENFSVKIESKEKQVNKTYIKDSVQDSVQLKAYSNWYYLAAAFRKKFEDSECSKYNCDEVMPKFDPLRISLAIARYAELMSLNDTQYTKDYEEIKQVSFFVKYFTKIVVYISSFLEM